MANLIIKPTSGGSLILQDEGGTAANTIDASGNTQLAGTLGVTGNVTMSGTANTLGTVTTGNISNTAIVYPAGHVIRTTKVHDPDVASHINTSSTSPEASGLIVSTPATTGSNYNIIHFSTSGWLPANVLANFYLFASKNGAAYSIISGADNQANNQHVY